ncbi:MAG: hypothetical protein MAG451_01389 [Anaerolineales bacterium]|nr:hypothetical protein [Anaerolineales bacterium]
MCFGCGMENPIGLKLFFYEADDGRVVARFTPQEEHQGYPGVLHGGIISTVLDETIGRVCIAQERWVVTAKMEVRYRQPIPIDETLLVVGEVVEDRGRRLTARGELRLPDGSVGAEATGTFIQLPEEEVDGMEEALRFWQVVPDEDGPPDFELGGGGAEGQGG